MEKAIEENNGNINIDLKEMGELISKGFTLQTPVPKKFKSITEEIEEKLN